MTRHHFIMAAVATATIAGITLTTSHLAAQEPAQQGATSEPQMPSDAMIEQAKARLGGGPTNLAAKMDAARAKGETLESDMRNKAALMAAENTKANIEAMRQRFADNAKIAEHEKRLAEKAPCADPPAVPPTDGSALCVPGAHEN